MVKTRWNSEFDMLERMKRLQQPLSDVLSRCTTIPGLSGTVSHEFYSCIGPENKGFVVSLSQRTTGVQENRALTQPEEELLVAWEAKSSLPSPFFCLFSFVLGDLDNITSPLTAPLSAGADESDHDTTDNNNNEINSIDDSDQIHEIYQNDADKPLAYNFSKNLIQSLKIRFSEIESDTLHRKCSFLDPRYRDYLFPDEKTKEEIKKEIKDEIIAYKLSNETYQVESESISESASVKPTKFWDFMKQRRTMQPKIGLDLFNSMMKYLFDNCRTEFGTIGFWGIDRIFLADDEIDFVLLNDSEVFERSPTRRIKFLVKIYEGFNLRRPIINLFSAVPTPEIETVFVFDKGGYRPTIVADEFEWYQELFRNSKVYYCFEWERQIGIITLNSFADVAPAIWMKDPRIYMHINPDNSSVQWWIYVTLFTETIGFNVAKSVVCKNMFFDRTKKLNGYTIRAAANINYHFDPIYKKIDGLITKASDIRQAIALLDLRVGEFSKALVDYLDVSIEITHGIPVNITLNPLRLLMRGIIEIYLSPSSLKDKNEEFDATNHVHLSYPFYFFYEQIVTHNRGLATPLEKMFEFYGWLTIIATSIILLGVLIVIYLSKSKHSSKFTFAVFECLRLLIGNSIYTRMDTDKMRIFFSVIFLYFLIIQATFSGHLAAFLTKPVYRKNVETLEDLEDPRFTKIYATEGSRDYVTDTPLYNKTIFDEYECAKYMCIGDPSVACIDEQNYLIPLIAIYHLHTPKNFIRVSYATLTMPHNSALKHRVNNLLMRLAQSGILNVWNKAWKELLCKNATNYLKKIEDIIENYYRPIVLRDMTFAFVLLGIGLFFAIISFILENSLKTFALNKTKISSWPSSVKRSTIHSVRFVVSEFRILLKWLYISLVKVVGWEATSKSLNLLAIRLTSKMMKLIALMLVQNIVIGQIQVPPEDGLDLFNNMMRYLFNNCRSEFRSIGFWSTDKIFLVDDEVDFVLVNRSSVFRRPPTRRFNFFVAVITKFDHRMPAVRLRTVEPTLRIENMSVFDESGYRKPIMLKVFQWYQKKLKNSKVYYCYMQNDEIVIITLNTFANIAPTPWIGGQFIQIIGIDRLWSTFKITYNKEAKFIYAGFELCKNMFFDCTKKLDGYKIKAAAILKNRSKKKFRKLEKSITKANYTSQGPYMITKRIKRVSKILTNYLNVTIEITHRTILGNQTSYIAKLIEHGSVELCLTPTILVDTGGKYNQSSSRSSNLLTVSLTLKMKKLIALMLVQSIVIGQVQVPLEDGLDLFNNMMKYLFNNCRTEFGTIGFWGIDRIFLADDEIDFVLLNDSEVFERSPTRRIKFLVKIYEGFNLRRPIINLFSAVPTPEIETVFVFDKGGNRPRIAVGEFYWYQKLFRNSKVYYCFEWERQIGIITFNAFADVAQALWIKVPQIYPSINPDNSSVEWWNFGAIYKKETKFDYVGSQLCKNIFFDRTEKLNGYTIRAAAKIYNYFDPIFKKIDGLITKATDIEQLTAVFSLRRGLFSKALVDSLNVSIEITHGMPIDITLNPFELLMSGDIEIDLTLTTWMNNDGEFDMMNYVHLSYPFFFFYEHIVTQNRGLATPLEKMFEFYGWLTPIATSIILLVVLVVIYLPKSVNSSKFSFAVFECLRLLIGNSIYTRMDTAKMRIFFSVIFLYFLIIQATFSGHLAAFLIKPVYRKNVETLEDLEDPRYTKIYAGIRNADYINGTPLYKKTSFGKNECKKYIVDPSVACIDEQSYLSPLIATYKLHTPKNFFKLNYATLTMPHNSALKHRVNNLLMRLEQSGIRNAWISLWQELTSKNLTYHLRKMEDNVENYHRPIELEDVTFAFYFLGIGLFFAIISFILENSLKTFASDKIKITSWLSTVKQSTIHIVHFVIFKFRILLKCLYINLVNVVDWQVTSRSLNLLAVSLTLKMKKLIALVLIQNFVIGKIQIPPEDGLDLFNHMMRYLFDNCRMKFGTIGFWGTDRIFLADDEVDFVLLSDSEVFKKSPTRRIKFLVKIYEKLNLSRPMINLFLAVPTPQIETISVFDKGGYRAMIAAQEFEWYQNAFQNSKVYYCFVKKEEVAIVTLNVFANIAPSPWTRNLFNQLPQSVLPSITYRTRYDKQTKFNDAFLTKPVYRKNVETLEDLEDPRYTHIYANVMSVHYIKGTPLYNKSSFSENEYEQYIRDPSVACIDKQKSLLQLIPRYKLYTSKNSIRFSYSSLSMTHNWGLRHRVNNIVMRLAQSGILDFWDKNTVKKTKKIFETSEYSTENYHRPIKLEDVIFAFVLLLIVCHQFTPHTALIATVSDQPSWCQIVATNLPTTCGQLPNLKLLTSSWLQVSEKNKTNLLPQYVAKFLEKLVVNLVRKNFESNFCRQLGEQPSSFPRLAANLVTSCCSKSTESCDRFGYQGDTKLRQ
ncbi:Protein of unknown function [Cotesia congregata]|uniref:Uncharacterized protein n=1 Tax=Cotesia congregata TaxID=51543 RepID=A0A8J2HG54_COTCN|nr:Protein of unknown function [Cotesia congregata]